MITIVKRFIVFFLLFFSAILYINAQENTSIKTFVDSSKVDTNESVVAKRKHSPQTASYLSAILPGAGQVFNRKYWKVPIVYAGFAFGLYLNRSYNSSYQTYKDLYNSYRNPYPKGKVPPTDTLLIYKGQGWSPSVIQEARNKMRKNRDFTTICLSAWYVLNIVDACVDAYFFDYDMTDNLSLHIKPQLFYTGNETYYPGLSLRLTSR